MLKIELRKVDFSIKWDRGLVIKYDNTQVILDPTTKNPNHENIFITHAHQDHSKALFSNKNPKHRIPITLTASIGSSINILRETAIAVIIKILGAVLIYHLV